MTQWSFTNSTQKKHSIHFSYLMTALKVFHYLIKNKNEIGFEPLSENRRAFPEYTSEMQLSTVRSLLYQFQKCRTEPEDSVHHNKSGFCAYKQTQRVIKMEEKGKSNNNDNV